jgi:uncharacterized protein
MARSAKQTVTAYNEALNAKDWDRFAELLHPELSYEIMSFHLPGGGSTMDKATTVQMLPGMVSTIFDADGPRIEIKHLVGEGDWVVAEAHGTGTLVEGTPYENRYALVYEVVDGQIKTAREYMDTQQMAGLLAKVMPPE